MRRSLLTLLCVPLVLVAASPFHLDLIDSFPAEDEVITEAPGTFWLEFSAPPDMERSSFSVRGPDGAVALGDLVKGDKEEVVQAAVEGELAPGTYMLSWVAAPMDDHAVRGRFEFTVGEAH